MNCPTRPFTFHRDGKHGGTAFTKKELNMESGLMIIINQDSFGKLKELYNVTSIVWRAQVIETTPIHKIIGRYH
jgi:hypothetical protein